MLVNPLSAIRIRTIKSQSKRWNFLLQKRCVAKQEISITQQVQMTPEHNPCRAQRGLEEEEDMQTSLERIMREFELEQQHAINNS